MFDVSPDRGRDFEVYPESGNDRQHFSRLGNSWTSVVKDLQNQQQLGQVDRINAYQRI